MEAILCVKGCGFFGTAENRSMCSKCYNDFLKSELFSKTITAVDNEAAAAEITAKMESLTVKERVNRCKSCKKKVGLLGFRCRCDGLFCGRHRLPELHSCEVDYKTSKPSHSHSNGNPHLTLVKADKLEGRI